MGGVAMGPAGETRFGRRIVKSDVVHRPTDEAFVRELNLSDDGAWTVERLRQRRVASDSSVDSARAALGPQVVRWLESAEGDDQLMVFVALHVDVAEPAWSRDALRRQAAVQDAVLTWLDVHHPALTQDAQIYPTITAFNVSLSADHLNDLAETPGVRTVDVANPRYEPLTATHVDLRTAHQTTEFWTTPSGTSDLTGATPSAHVAGAGAMVLTVVDAAVDAHHPVFDDGTGSSRFDEIWRADGEPLKLASPPYDNCGAPVLTWPTSAVTTGPRTWTDVAATAAAGGVESTSQADKSEHGTVVAGLAAGSMLHGNYPIDAVVGQSPYAENRTASAPDAELISVESGRSYKCSTGAALRQWFELDLFEDALIHVDTSVPSDVVAIAAGGGSCNSASSSNMLADKIFIGGAVVAAGTGNVWSPSGCNVASPAFTPGTLTVGAGDQRVAALKLAPAWEESSGEGTSRGGDGVGRSIVDLMVVPATDGVDGIPNGSFPTGGIAPLQPAGGDGMTADHLDQSSASWSAQVGFANKTPSTSWATGTLAGNALLVREMVQGLPGAPAGDPGPTYAALLQMADGATPVSPGSSALTPASIPSNLPMDDLTGAGRLRLRHWTGTNLDQAESGVVPGSANAQGILFIVPLDEGDVFTFNLNEQVVGGTSTHFPIPTDVEFIEAAAFWFEPNYHLGPTDVAQINVSLRNLTTGGSWGPGTSTGDNKVRAAAPLPGGDLWALRVSGVSIPKSKHSDYHHNKKHRVVYVSVLWEDDDRDDVDGRPAPGVH